MGQRIDLVAQHSNGSVVVVARHDLSPQDSAVPSRSIESEFEAVIDFSSDAGSRSAVRLAQKANVAILIGTTGLSDETKEAMKIASSQIPVLIAPNTSIGVAVMRYLVSEAARLLSPDFEVSITEAHHVKKLDQPSGTALALADSVARGRGKPFPFELIESIREGDVVGDHEVIWSGPGEKLSLRHHAENRDLFALGAIRLAFWVAKQLPGLYGLDDWFVDIRKATD